MSREIKFRLRDDNNNIVGYEKWYSGARNFGTGLYEAVPLWLYSKDGENWNPTFIHHRYKDQFTGLKDKNGEEIYEGDFVDTHSGFDEPYIREVIWKDCGLCFTPFSGFVMCESNTKHFKVIGNRYENPGLLKGSDAE